VAADPIKDKPVENIFRITDEIVHQLNKTKKMVILMIVSIVIVLPATHIISFALIGDTEFDGSDEGRPPWFDGSDGGGPPNNPAFRVVQGLGLGSGLCFQNGLKSTSSTKTFRKRSMKSWIMMMIKTK
jgi:hypothetical protein